LRLFRSGIVVQLAILLALGTTFNHEANAQSEIRRGVLPLARMNDWAEQPVTLSTGVIANLETDPNFQGDFQTLYGVATNILSGYTVVNRAGYFPENQGIPREQQLALNQAVYYFFILPSGNGLILYRSPSEDSSRYIIRRPGAGFLLR
jgi:hypothetical protein